jgi:hypothetical protein
MLVRARLPMLLLAVSLAGWIVSIVLTWPTFFGMGPATGDVAALADAVCRGLAPGHDDGRALIASVYLPPFPCAVATVHALGLDWLTSLRVLSVTAALALLVAATWAVRSAGGGARGVMVACALILPAYPFVAASLSGRADLMTAALSIAGLAAWQRDRELKGWALPALAAAAWFSKFTALALPLAIVLSSVRVLPWRHALRFGVRFLAALAALIALSIPVHGPGWMLDAFHTTRVLAGNTSSLLRGPGEFLRYLGSFPELMVSCALALTLITRRAWRTQPLAMFVLASWLLALVVMANHGASDNHLIELFAGLAVASGLWCERALARSAALPAWLLAIAIAGATWRESWIVLRHAGEPIQRRGAALAVIRAESGEVFSEDALLSLAAGKRPAIVDPLVFRQLEIAGDARALRIAHDLENGRYGLVALNGDPFDDASRAAYRTFNLGPVATAALASRYASIGVLDDVHLGRRR